MNKQMKVKYKIGQRLTIVNKGIRRSDYSNRLWIDDRIKGRATYFEVSKHGTKYLYGYCFFKDIDGLRKSSIESKLLLADYVIHTGFVPDKIKQYNDYTRSLDDYQKLRQEGIRKIDSWCASVKNKMIKEWEFSHPRPKSLKVR